MRMIARTPCHPKQLQHTPTGELRASIMPTTLRDLRLLWEHHNQTAAEAGTGLEAATFDDFMRLLIGAFLQASTDTSRSALPRGQIAP